MDKLEKSDQKVLFIHSDGELKAAITDGDIRRWILKGGKLNEPVQKAANYQPVFVDEAKRDLAVQIMTERGIDAIPLVDKDGRIKRIYFLNGLNEKFTPFERAIPVVIMAGGEGNRLSPYTQVLPKPLIPIGELPIAEHIINQFMKYGCNDFRMIINYKRNMIKAYFNELKKNYMITYVNEENSLGTGGGLSLLKGSIDTTFILTNCDILIFDDLNEAYKQHKDTESVITMICSRKYFEVPYGIIHIKEDKCVKSIQEKPSMTFYTNTGCYFVEPEVVEELEYNKPVDFPEIINKYIEYGKKVGAYIIDENMWQDMGQIEELKVMKERLGY